MKKVCGVLLWGFSLLSVAQMIQSAKIAMYLDKASGLGYFPNFYQSEEGYMKELPIDIDKGRYVSITVTNHFNDDKPIEFDLGHHTCESGIARLRTQVPAGETVTRTIKVTAQDGQAIDPLYMFAGYSDGTHIDGPTDITISSIQFEV